MKAALPFHSEKHIGAGIVWIPPWSADVFTRCMDIQLDTSFTAIKPCVYSVPLGVNTNESCPLANVLGISETKELHRILYRGIHIAGVSQTKPGST
jgi:hypothetical protein